MISHPKSKSAEEAFQEVFPKIRTELQNTHRYAYETSEVYRMAVAKMGFLAGWYAGQAKELSPVIVPATIIEDERIRVMRQDGEYSIYTIQVQLDSSKKWVDANLDHFGYPTRDWNASGDCWQVTGVKGVFYRPLAEQGLAIIREQHPNSQFRLVRRKHAQYTEVLSG